MPGRKYMIETACFFSAPSNLKLYRFVFLDVVRVLGIVVFMSLTKIDRTWLIGSRTSPSSVRRTKFEPLIAVSVCSLGGAATAGRLARLDASAPFGFAVDERGERSSSSSWAGATGASVFSTSTS